MIIWGLDGLIFSWREMVFIIFYQMCYAGPKYYNFKLICTFYKVTLYIKVHYKGFHKNILWILVEVPSGFSGK